ncbi:uncharacterized protein LOC143018489 isoform X2 [Oratosquilla oratoria]
MWLILMILSYLAGWALSIEILVWKYNLEEPPKNRFLYVIYFIVPHLLAGIKNLQYTWKEVGSDGEAGDWIVPLLTLPFSPLTRYLKAFQAGTSEDNDPPRYGHKFVEECYLSGVLRLFDTFLGDAPILSLLVRDDIWARSEEWKDFVVGHDDPLCGRACQAREEDFSELHGILARKIFLLIKMALTVTFYTLMLKRRHRFQQQDNYGHRRHSSARTGRVNIFGCLLLFLGHFFFIGSRIMGYSMVSAAIGSWVFLVVGAHWLINSTWHLITIMNSGWFSASGSVSSITIGGIWLFALTNEEGGKQLGRLILFYSLSLVDTIVCGFLWNNQMDGSGDYFAYKAPWTVLILYLMGVCFFMMYYTLCHPGTPTLSLNGLLCCKRAQSSEEPIPVRVTTGGDGGEGGGGWGRRGERGEGRRPRRGVARYDLPEDDESDDEYVRSTPETPSSMGTTAI